MEEELDFDSTTLAVGVFSKSISKSSSIHFTGIISRFSFIFFGISTRSLAFSLGITTVVIPPLRAANNFSFKPPMGSTSPLKVISPVIATFALTGIPVNEDTRAVGNMNVNARGDVLGRSGQVVETKQEVVKKYYEMPRGRADDTPIRMRQTPALQPKAPQPKVVESKPAPQPRVTRQAKSKATPKTGIDAALDGLE